jgi:ribosomal protein S12 methylthiotransferase accessory factor
MAHEIVVTHVGNKKIDATVNGFTIHTDQHKDDGGDSSAPEPYTLFLSSLATCAGMYVVGFCQTRDIPTEGIRLVQDHSFDDKTGLLLGINIRVEVPPSFPEKYHKALIKAAKYCTVKKTLEEPPPMEVSLMVEGVPEI